MEKVYDVLVIGGGPAGYSAALYGKRAGFDVLLLEKSYPGGQMTQTHQIDNYPGFPDGVDGFTLAMKMEAQAKRFGIKSMNEEVLAVDLNQTIKEVKTNNQTYYAYSVVIATGANPRPLQVAKEDYFTGKGLAYCAACDGAFFRGKKVFVIGGGNTAIEDALLLSRMAKHVTIVHRRNEFSAQKVLVDELMQQENVDIIWNSEVIGLLGDSHITGLTLKNKETNEIQSYESDGIFVSVGRVPNTTLFHQLNINEQGYIIANEDCKTNLKGVYAIGDVRTKPLRQIVGAVSDGANAIHAIQQELGEIKNQ